MCRGPRDRARGLWQRAPPGSPANRGPGTRGLLRLLRETHDTCVCVCMRAARAGTGRVSEGPDPLVGGRPGERTCDQAGQPDRHSRLVGAAWHCCSRRGSARAPWAGRAGQAHDAPATICHSHARARPRSGVCHTQSPRVCHFRMRGGAQADGLVECVAVPACHVAAARTALRHGSVGWTPSWRLLGSGLLTRSRRQRRQARPSKGGRAKKQSTRGRRRARAGGALVVARL